MGIQKLPVSGDRRPILGILLVQLGYNSPTLFRSHRSRARAPPRPLGTESQSRGQMERPGSSGSGSVWEVKEPGRGGRGKPKEKVKHELTYIVSRPWDCGRA